MQYRYSPGVGEGLSCSGDMLTVVSAAAVNGGSRFSRDDAIGAEARVPVDRGQECRVSPRDFRRVHAGHHLPEASAPQ